MYSFRNGRSGAPRPSFIAAPRTQLGANSCRWLDLPVGSREQPSPRRSHVQSATLAMTLSRADWDMVFRHGKTVSGDQVWLAADDVVEQLRVPTVVRSCSTQKTVVPRKLASQGVFQHTLPQTRARRTPEKERTPMSRTPNHHHRGLGRTLLAPPAIIPRRDKMTRGSCSPPSPRRLPTVCPTQDRGSASPRSSVELR